MGLTDTIALKYHTSNKSGRGREEKRDMTATCETCGKVDATVTLGLRGDESRYERTDGGFGADDLQLCAECAEDELSA